MLYIINNLPISPAFFDNTHYGDSVIFTESAVLALQREHMADEKSLTQKALSHINLYARKADLLIRNISNQDLLRGGVVIDEMQYQTAIDQDLAIKSNN